MVCVALFYQTHHLESIGARNLGFFSFLPSLVGTPILPSLFPLSCVANTELNYWTKRVASHQLIA